MIGVGAVVGIAIAISFSIIAVIFSLWICLRRRKVKVASNGVGMQMAPTHDYEAARPAGLVEFSDDSPLKFHIIESSHSGPRSFTYEQLSLATKHFSDTELLGQGGSGSVYRGELSEDGTLVAIKCIDESSDHAVKEFNAEITIISELEHENLVKLIGWCQGQGKFLVVYDYMPNGSLDHLLYKDALCAKLTWERRYAIAKGLGSALLYLHEECSSGKVIIHRDVKFSNVLLDEGFVAKLGDFGLSRQVGPDATSHLTSEVAGTRGYMAPEILLGSRKATRETDMYAFGVVLLEMVSGKRPLDASLQDYNGVLVDWVWDLYGQERVLLAVDKRLGGEWDSEEARRMLVVGLACSHPDAQSRPKMRRALQALNGTVALPHVPFCKPTPSFGPSLPIMSISQIVSQMGSNAASKDSNCQYSGYDYVI